MKLIPPLAVPDSGAFSRASTATYFDSAGTMQSAANDVARLNYDPSDLTRPPAWLIEAAAANLLPYSEDFSSWTNGGVGIAVATNVITAPDGTMTGDRLTDSSISADAWRSMGGTVIADAGVKTLSLHVQQDTAAQSYIDFSLTLGGHVTIYGGSVIDWATKTANVVNTSTAGGGAGAILGVRMEMVGYGWWRWSVQLQNDGFATLAVLGIRPANQTSGGTLTATGSMFAWGAMCEEGAGPTSYIKTTASTVSRAADVNTLGLLSNVAELDASVGETAWSGATKYIAGDQVANAVTHKIYQSLVGSKATVSITIATPGVITWLNAQGQPSAHTLTANAPVEFSTTGALPTGITAGVTYYVLNPTLTTFQLTTTPGGTAAVNTSGSQSGVQTVWANVNKNVDPTTDTTAAYWGDAGATNRWAPFDASPSSIARKTSVVAMAMKLGKRVDSIALLNIAGTAARVVMTDPTDGVVYDQTISLIDNGGVTSPYAWWFYPPRRKTDISIQDLPNYSAATIQVIIFEATGGIAQCGVCALGFGLNLGDSQYGARIGIQDYSLKGKDEFGRTGIVQRAFARRGQFDVWVKKENIDGVINTLAKYRATPVIYIGSSEFGSTMFYGFYKDFDTAVTMPAYAVLSVQIEGLT